MMADSRRPLAGGVGVVTGGGRGVGRGIVEALSEAGMAVGVVGRSESEIETAAAAARMRHVDAIAVPADVTDRHAVEAMATRVREELGPIDLLVNNAGRVESVGPPWETDPDVWWRDVEVNLRGPFLCSHAVLPGMVERASGRIVNVTSLAAAIPYPYASAYASSKAAVLRLTDSLAAALAVHGVAVFAISPGLVRTRLLDGLANSPQGRTWLPEFQSRTDWVQPAAAGRLVTALATGVADALSGRFIHVSDDLEKLVSTAPEVVSRDLRVLQLPLE
jgi:NAD(P)-dependent dehydrogenase (short-subunit alcohol dehydrogenase family)